MKRNVKTRDQSPPPKQDFILTRQFQHPKTGSGGCEVFGKGQVYFNGVDQFSILAILLLRDVWVEEPDAYSC